MCFITGSGTASMEAAVITTFSESDKILLIDAGNFSFGHRFAEILTIYNIPFEFFDNLKEVEFFGKPFKVPEKAEEFLSLHYGEDWKTPNPNNKGTYARFKKLL